MQKKYWFFLCLGAILLLSACDGPFGGFGLSEGVIEYESKPVDPNNPLAGFAPNKMTVKFKDDKVAYGFTAGFGMFTMTLISNPQQRSLTQLIKLMSEKMVHVSDEKELVTEYAELPKFAIKESNETKEIAGYKCKKATIVYEDTTRSSVEVYYTKDIRIKDPNWSTPFNQIDGMLMEYQIERFGIEMHFIAKSVTKEKVEDAVFETPADYKVVPKSKFNELFDGFK